MAAAVLLAGCGTAATGTAATGTAATGTAATGTAVGPGHRAGGPDGSRAKAVTLARHLLQQLSLPPGTRPAHVRSLPAPLRDPRPPGTGWAEARRILLAPGKPRAVWEKLLPHAPFNEPAQFGAVPVSVGTLLTTPAPGVDAAQLDVSMVAESGTTTLVAAYAYAAWLPSRTAAEHLDPAGLRAVTITADQFGPGPHRVRRTFTSAAVIAGLAAFLNGRPPAPAAALAGVSCPAPPVTFTLRFTAAGSQDPAVAVATGGCLTDAITVDGRQQPLLWDTRGGLASMVRKLLGPALR